MIRLLDLDDLIPRAGTYRETFRDPLTDDGRAASTAIYFLLAPGEVALAPGRRGGGLALACRRAAAARDRRTDGLHRQHPSGTDLDAGERPQAVVPRRSLAEAESLGAWTLVGCTVAPGFLFAGFELAPNGFEPGG